MSEKSEYFITDQIPARLPLWRESYTGIDWLALHYSPVYYGLGLPRGDGSAVILVPGFLATDFYLREMAFWLKRVGYRPYLSEIGRNADCLDVLLEKLTNTVNKAYLETGGKVHLIGHSLGGVLSHAVAYLHPDKIASVVTLASPFRGISSHPLVLKAGEKVRQQVKEVRSTSPSCFSGSCDCRVIGGLKRPLPHEIAQTAIYTKSDGVVDWHYCITDNPDDNIEVPGTHIGLAFNPAVYRQISFHLAGKGRAALRHNFDGKKAS